MKLLCSLFVLCAALFAPLASAQLFNGNETKDPANSGPKRIEILRALYGAQGYRPLDATYALQDFVNTGERSVTVANGVLGADPAPGVAKILHIKYRVGHRIQTQVVNEGSVLVFDR